ncbi:hypothetical protein [Mucilaginibacter lacusdianchii]|uniref:hypothetical protein n=1 Tax=Mucilaginibacter lacusdianchii TaxID=2684211 RepID=UPI00131C8985|nr:hypothetical protein [Mucilaginibacter sp. JXJ CY 39]
MLFEEFFKKKKISLIALEQGEPALFSEFKEHYEQMGEKSFDHTKKYWFNKLRRLYPLPPEVKAEKSRMENQVAEQTVADTLTEPTPRDAAPKLDFKPKFKAGTTAPVKPAEDVPVENVPTTPSAPTEQKATAENEAPVTPAPKLGFKPKFKAAPAKPVEETPAELPPAAEVPAVTPAENTEKPAAKTTSATPKPAYKPRFQAKNIVPKAATEIPTQTDSADTTEQVPKASTVIESSEAEIADDTAAPSAEAPSTPQMGFKPRFKAPVPPKVVEETKAEPEVTPQPAVQEDPIQENNISVPSESDVPSPETPATKPAYKPRFNPKLIKPKPPEQE